MIMDYKDTLNLPKTSFPMKANLTSREPEILEFWHKKIIYRLIREKRKACKKYVLHDGPPYANGNIHMGHALNKILKDMVVKYMTMRGLDSPYVPGWDCHGLPVEHQLFKELGIKKGEINQVEFRKKARDYAMKYVSIQKDEFKRLGVFGDWEKPYLTLSHEYEAEIIKSFAKLVKDGFIYNDLKPVNWCATCETALAEAEVEYEDHSSPSIYVKFKLKAQSSPPLCGEISPQAEKLTAQSSNTYFIIWTTTPWTLLANTAIAVHPELEYALVDIQGEHWIVLDMLKESVLSKIGKKFNVVSKFKGAQLEGLIVEHPFIKRESKVVLADYVSSEEGTGCVHTAPGHGQEDYITGKKYNLPLIMPVNYKGVFDKTCGEFSGMSVSDANPKIIERMKKDNTLLLSEKVSHSYPHCWRCKKPIIFRATEQWFMSIDHKDLRKNMLSAIKKITWHPDAGMERISAMVSNRPDWCLSRQRYWGVPIPVFYCNACGNKLLDYDVIMHVADLVAKQGVDAWFKGDAKTLLPQNLKCPKCKSQDLRKESDILDVWFESGISHQAVLKNDKSLQYPCELYLEGSDQHRGWFQSALISGMAIDNLPPYKAVLTHGFTVDGEGKKMSKSLGNVIAPQDIMKKYGADILRLWVASSNYSDDVRISDEIIVRAADAYRKIRNTFRYLLSNLYDFDPVKDSIDLNKLEEIDRWMISKLAHLLKETTDSYNKFLFHKVYRAVYNFCVYEVSSLYLDILKDRMYTFKKDSIKRRSGQTVIYEILNILVKILAPILSFTMEEVWQEAPIKNKEESVHLCDWPFDDEKINEWINEGLDKKWDALIPIRESVLKALEEKRIEGKIGSSLEAKIILSAKNSNIKEILSKNIKELPTLFIVSQVEIKDESIEGAKDFSESGIFVSVQNADGEKCARCWNYSVTVGRDKNHPNICKKCLDNI